MSVSTPYAAPERTGRDDFGVIAVILGAMALVVALVGAGFGMRAIDEAKDKGTGVSAGGGTASIALKEFSITPATLTLGLDGSITVTNEGTVQHDLAVKGHEGEFKMNLLSPGQTGKLDLSGLAAGSYEIYCTVPGHADAGMKAALTISGSGAPSGTVTPPASELTGEQMDESAHAKMLQFPAATKGDGGKLLEPTVLPNGVKHYDLTVDVVQWEVEPGRIVEAWAYNGQVPGPTIKAHSGDKLEIKVTNNLKESTTVHWHGIDVPNSMDGVPDVTQEQIKPGASFTYAFDAIGPAVGMYHAHSDSQKQVPMGLSAGMLIMDLPVPAGVQVSQEIPFIVNDGGQLGFTINGKAFPATKPIVAKVGETILVHYFNEGLQVHPMHLHGPTQLVIAKDGHPLKSPYEADTILIGPGERYSVLITPNRPGTWVWHCHILTHAEAPAGFIGMTTALVVQ
jgi:FtsP/CotA-like multicopper oxidase with cupredoxin domain